MAEEEKTGEVYVSVVGLRVSTTRTTPTFTRTPASKSMPAKSKEMKLVKLQLDGGGAGGAPGTEMLCISGDLCPVSGRAAIHWQVPDGGSNIILYDI